MRHPSFSVSICFAVSSSSFHCQSTSLHFSLRYASRLPAARTQHPRPCTLLLYESWHPATHTHLEKSRGTRSTHADHSILTTCKRQNKLSVRRWQDSHCETDNARLHQRTLCVVSHWPGWSRHISPGWQGKGGRCRPTPAGDSLQEARLSTSTKEDIKQVPGTEASRRALLEKPPETVGLSGTNLCTACYKERGLNTHFPMTTMTLQRFSSRLRVQPRTMRLLQKEAKLTTGVTTNISNNF